MPRLNDVNCLWCLVISVPAPGICDAQAPSSLCNVSRSLEDPGGRRYLSVCQISYLSYLSSYPFLMDYLTLQQVSQRHSPITFPSLFTLSFIHSIFILIHKSCIRQPFNRILSPSEQSAQCLSPLSLHCKLHPLASCIHIQLRFCVSLCNFLCFSILLCSSSSSFRS